MKLIIAGFRTFHNYGKLTRELSAIPLWEITEIVNGGATGADRLGEQFAKENNIPVKVFQADWNQYGKKAGPIRNHEMAKYADQAIVFHENNSKGASDMILKMSSLSKPCKVITIHN